MNIVTYRLSVQNNEAAIEVINNWLKPGQFDDVAFRNAERGKLQVRVQDIQKIT